MEYSNEFKDLLLKSKESLVGWGNPNASILIIGKESAIPKDNDPQGKEQYEREIIKNHEFWERNRKQCISQDDIVPIQFYDGNDIIKNIEEYNPLYPYKGQLNRVRRVFRDENGKEYKVTGKRGTSKTWHNYQHLSDLIFKGGRTSSDEIIDFHCYIFTTELSDVAAPTSYDPNKLERLSSIEDRKVFFRNDFFKSFPIIILAAGNYPERFGVNYINFWGPTLDVETINNPCKGIYKIIYAKGEQRRLFIQTYQLSMVSENLIVTIADYCRRFLIENHIII